VRRLLWCLLTLSLTASCGRLGYDFLGGSPDDDGGTMPLVDASDNGIRDAGGFIDGSFITSDADLALPVDPKVIVTSPGVATTPVLAWDGSGYILVWIDDRTGNREVFMQPLDANGDPRAGEVQVSSGAGPAGVPHVAVSNQQYGVAWRREDGGTFYQFQRVGFDGLLVGPVVSGEPVSSVFGPQFAVTVGTNGSDFAIVSRSADVVSYRVIDSAGNMLVDEAATGPLAFGAAPVKSASWSGTRFGFAWVDGNLAQFRTHDGTTMTPTTRASAVDVYTAGMVWAHGKFAVASTSSAGTNLASVRLEFFDGNGISTGTQGIGTVSAPIGGTNVNSFRATLTGYDLVRSESPIGSQAYFRYELDQNGMVVSGPTSLTTLGGGAQIATTGPVLAAVWGGGVTGTVSFLRLP
jgi:hypothetical protein